MALIDNIVAYWKFDETSPIDASDSVGSRTLTNTSGALFVSGVINNGALLNGGSEYFHRATEVLGIVNSWTISGWVKFDEFGSSDVMFELSSNSTDINRVDLFSMNGNFRVVIANSTGSSYKDFTATTNTFTVDTYCFVTVTWDASVLNLYMNGTLQTVTKTIDNTVVQTNSSRRIYVGRGDLGSALQIDGEVDEWGYWSRALSNAEVTQLYNGGIGLQYPFTLTTTSNALFIGTPF